MTDMVTARSIVQWFEGKVGSKEPISPSVWADAGMKLIALQGAEDAKMIELECKCRKLEKDFFDNQEGKKNKSAARMSMMATEDYRDWQLQVSFCKQIHEFVLMAKVRARLAMDEAKGYA